MPFWWPQETSFINIRKSYWLPTFEQSVQVYTVYALYDSSYVFDLLNRDISKFMMQFIVEEIDENTSLEDLQKMMAVALAYRVLVCVYEVSEHLFSFMLWKPQLQAPSLNLFLIYIFKKFY